MQFKAFQKGIEVNGQTVYAVIDGLGSFKTLAYKYLAKSDIGKFVNGEYVFDKEAWYKQEDWLKAFELIAREIGDPTLQMIGAAIPKNAKFPPWVKNIETAIQAINIAYHMNHRKDGKILFEESTNQIKDGIGSYGFEKIQDKNLIISECLNPYPCAFDKGILSAMTSRFSLTATVIHDDSRPCRKNGMDSCTYIISWK